MGRDFDIHSAVANFDVQLGSGDARAGPPGQVSNLLIMKLFFELPYILIHPGTVY